MVIHEVVTWKKTVVTFFWVTSQYLLYGTTETVVIYLQVIIQYLPCRTEENHKNLS
jgi:hypothetical protein